MEIERRGFAIEYRVEGEEKPKIRGYAARFNEMSEEMMGFREKIAPGAFKKTLKEADVRALFNHDPNIVLGRTKSGTLTLREDQTGLFMEIEPNLDDSEARNVMARIERGDVNQASFAFRVDKESWNYEAKPPERTLNEVQLYDVSPVTYPAYPQTSVDIRSLVADLDNKTHPPEPSPDTQAEEPAEATPESEPREHSEEEVKIRPLSILFQELRLAMEADAQIKEKK